VSPTSENSSEGNDRSFDLVVIGGGPAGYAAALYGAAAGLNIALVEMSKVGGTCLHVGCIPAKELLETAAVYRTVKEAAEFGISAGEPTIDLGVSQARKRKVIDQLFNGLAGLLKRRKVTVFDGVGSLLPDRRVRISGGASGDVEITGTHIALASGSKPRTLPGFEVDGRIVLTSDEFLDLDHVPGRAVVIGGGAIGCEFASTMADLGTQVTILEALPKILPGCDPDAAKIVERSFAKRNIAIRTGVPVTGHTPTGQGDTVVHFGEGETTQADVVVVSIGRRPFADLLGLEGTGVRVSERGYVEIDERYRTGEPGVYAIGDLVATPQLAHVGFAEGMFVVQDLLGEEPVPIDAGRVPWCIYCHPEVAFAGHTEQSAKDAGYDVVTSTHRFAGNGRAMIVGGTDGLVKVIAEKRADGTAGQILGVHMVGPWVTEQLGQAYLAVNWEATVDEVAAFIQPPPPRSELFGETVLSLTGRSLHG
jgi:dihydrolipoamide dehydrogenase